MARSDGGGGVEHTAAAATLAGARRYKNACTHSEALLEICACTQMHMYMCGWCVGTGMGRTRAVACRAWRGRIERASGGWVIPLAVSGGRVGD